MAANALRRLLEWLNQTIDRLFDFELEADEVIGLTATPAGTSPRKATVSTAE
jgi:hypothetical protein